MSTICKAIKYLCTVIVPWKTELDTVVVPSLATKEDIEDLQEQITNLIATLGSYASKNADNTFSGKNTFNSDHIINGDADFKGGVIFSPIALDPGATIPFNRHVEFNGNIVYPTPMDQGNPAPLVFDDAPELPGITVNGIPRMTEDPPPAVTQFGSGAGTATASDVAIKVDAIINNLIAQGVFQP
jgi:hypothetical protein